MSGSLVNCPNCGRKNRVPAASEGVPRCGNCHRPLPWVADASDDTFAAVAEGSDLPVIVDFWAAWCGPCRMVTPVLEDLARELAGRIKLVKVDVDASPSLARRFEVQHIPTLMILRHGQVAARRAGAAPAAELRVWVENATAKARP
ncbi:thioredoxin [Thermoactinospora rubra]|uniref:thioredoxin n=1 Tax=Thermoactinospora rubra TaxID=1088767 RepID=UPI000A11051F|nr:thioredoxin [Thermoactinospora rubra]